MLYISGVSRSILNQMTQWTLQVGPPVTERIHSRARKAKGNCTEYSNQVSREQEMIHYQDITVGSKQSFGSYQVTREEVIEFASNYDPQAFHLDDDAAAKTFFGKISASGWHTCAMTMRMMVDNMTIHKVASLGSPGVEEIRWLIPVYPGDTLRCESEVLEKRPSKSKPEMGSYRSIVTVHNQDDRPVMTMLSTGFIRVRSQ